MRRIEKAFAPVPEQVHERVKLTLTQLRREEKSRRVRPVTALIAAIVLMLALAGAAVAANYAGVLDFLFNPKIDDVPEEATGMVQSLNAAWSGDGVSIRVDEALCDGVTLNLALTAKTEKEPYYLAIESVTFAGEEIRCTHVGAEMVSRFIGHPQKASGEEQHIGIAAPRSRRVEGKAEVEVHLALMQTKRDIVLGDFFSETEPEATIAQGKAVAWDWNEYWILADPNDEEMLHAIQQERGLPTRTPSSPILCAQYAAEMEVVHDVWLRFEVDVPEVSFAARYETAPDSPVQAEMIMVEVTPLTSMVEFYLYPKDQAQHDAWLRGYGNEIVLPDGSEPSYNSMSGRSYNSLTRQEPTQEHPLRLLFATVMPGMTSAPEEFLVAPFGYPEEPDASGSYPTEFDMENAVKLRRIDENLNIVQ